MNIAMALNAMGLRCALLSCVGQDAEGKALLAVARNKGLVTDHVYMADDLPTDRYMAIEADGSLIAAIADAHSLEAAGERILAPMSDGRLASSFAPYQGMVALDGNLTVEMLHTIATGEMFSKADLRVAPASPGKAERLRVFITHGNATIYVNLAEANTLCGTLHQTAESAARALLLAGLRRVLVTNGSNTATLASNDAVYTLMPPRVDVKRITGAGDVLMASHMAAEARDETGQAAFKSALARTAEYISSETPL